MAVSTQTRRSRGKERVAIPNELERKLLLESGFRCSIPQCMNTEALEIHHINGDPSDNDEDNLLVLCALHHAIATKPKTKLDRKTCRMLKQTISKLSVSLAVDRDALRQAWQEVTGEDAQPAEAGMAMESLVSNLLSSIPGFVVAERRYRTATEEIDILVRNESSDPFLQKFGRIVLVECKAMSRPVGPKEVARFVGSLSLRRSETGLFFSASGFTEAAILRTAQSAYAEIFIVLWGPDDISDLIEADDRVEVFKRVATRSLLGG